MAPTTPAEIPEPEAPEPEVPETRRNRERPERSERRRGRKALIAFFTLIALVLAGFTGFAYLLNRALENNVARSVDLPTEGPTDASGKPVEIPKNSGVNILLIGSDARPTDTFSRADVIVLVHVPEDRAKVHLVHFPRDLFVDIPGHSKNKINAAYAFGGSPLLVQTVQNLVGVKIDHIAQTDFEGFKSMTDAVGGVRVFAEEPSSGITQGWNDLNGEQALGFVRQRYQLSEGDISRGRRQMAFVKALLTKALSKETITNPARILDFANAATTNLVVDKTFSTAVMREYAFSLRSVRSSDVEFATAPFSGYGSDPRAGSIDIVDVPRMAELGTLIRTDRLDEWKDGFVIP